MNDIIDPNYQWKEAATQEGVDYGAVQKSFMDQSYGVVANKAKILFQDPFRLGFEIVHRNEKATKMVGIFAFRVNNNLMYAPTFFVNGEIKAADMLYRADVKRFVPLTEDWCAYLVRGVHESAGETTDKNRHRQADAYMDRLAYPQRVKYASEAEFVEQHMALPKDELIARMEKQAGGGGNLLKLIGAGTGGAILGGGVGSLAGNIVGRKKGLEEGLAEGFAAGNKEGTDAVLRNILAGLYSKMSELDATGRDNPLPEGLLGKQAKYASEMEVAGGMVEDRDAFVKAAADGSLWNEILLHSADNSPMRKLLPAIINETGPEALEKVAALVDGSPKAERYLATNYTREELETVDAWMAKEASAEGPQPAITINIDPRMAKSASSRECIFDKGYELVDTRPNECLNAVVEEISDENTVKELSAPGKVNVMLDNGDMEECLLLRVNDNLLHDPHVPMSLCNEEYSKGKPECVYFPDSKELLTLPYGQAVFGDCCIDQEISTNSVAAPALTKGKTYVALSSEVLAVSDPFTVKDIAKDGECLNISISNKWGDDSQIFFTEGRKEAQGRYISDETRFLEVKCETDKDAEDDDCCVSSGKRITCACDKVLMNSGGIDQWMRTAGGVTTSRDLKVKQNDDLSFDVEHSEGGTILKSASNLGMLEAHLTIAEDFCLTTDKAGEILDKAVDNDVSYRVFDTMDKQAYLTRPEGMEDWIQSYDPELQVQLDAPQQQILSTHTPTRPDQQSRYGDVHQRVPAENSKTGSDLLPMDAIMSQSPEQLAQMSEQYDLPHIFDHGAVGQMATTSHNIVDQIKKYIPDLESGVDRYFRILFLLRYRPSDFEEIYGKDDLVDFEQELGELAGKSGENLLRLLQQFDPHQYSAQEN